MGKVQEHKKAAKAKHQLDFTKSKTGSQSDRFEVFGEVEQCLPNTMFKVKILDSDVEQMKDRTLLGTLAGKMRLYRIRVMPGDLVKGYVSKYDLNKCKITYRSTGKKTQTNQQS